MLRATTIVRKPAVRPDAVADLLTLDHAARSRRRGELTAQGGLAVRLDLDRDTVLEDGDALRLEDGRLVRIVAAPQALLEVRSENPSRLIRLAWQLGSNHVQAEIGAEALYVLADPVVAELIRGQGCTATPVERPFRPEREAVAHDHSQCGHDHHHGHEHAQDPGHGHAHDHGQSHGHDHAHEHHGHDGHPHGHHGHRHDHAGHAHGPDCGCGHKH